MIRTIAVAAVAIWACGEVRLAAEMADLERRRLLAHMEMTAAWLGDEVAGLSAAQFKFRPAPGQWSVAEVVDHLIVVGPI